MLKYNCNCCDFLTNNKTDYNRHIKTKKHIRKLSIDVPENITIYSPSKTSNEVPYIAQQNSTKLGGIDKNPDFLCKYCDLKFKRSFNMNRHFKTCSMKKDFLGKESLEKKLQEKDKMLKEKTKQMEKLERDKEYYKKLIDNYNSGSGFMGTKNFNSITYILNSYPSAPHLKAIEPKKIKQFRDIDINNIRDIISDYRNNRLVSNIIEAILFIHKKKDPSKQSIWATDSTRHNYIIKELLKDKDSYWVVDKKGIKSENYLIKPILSFIREKIIEYLDTANELLINSELTSFKRDVIMDSQKYGSQLIKDIDDGIISKDIIKNLAKHIHHHNKPQIEEVE